MISVDYDDKTQVTDGFLSELPHNKFLIFKGCGELTRSFMEPSPNQGLLLDSLVVAREVDSGAAQVFDGRFVRKCKNPVADKLIFELVESDDPYGFRLLIMAKDLQDDGREAISIQALDQRTEIQLGLAIENQKAILSVKKRLTCELLIYCSQTYPCLYGSALSHGYGKKYSWFIKWKFVEAKVTAYYLTSLVNFFDVCKYFDNQGVLCLVVNCLWLYILFDGDSFFLSRIVVVDDLYRFKLLLMMKCNKVRDASSSKVEVQMRLLDKEEDVKSRVYTEKLTKKYVSSMKNVTQWLVKEWSNGRIGAASIIPESLCSHGVFTCIVECWCKGVTNGDLPTKEFMEEELLPLFFTASWEYDHKVVLLVAPGDEDAIRCKVVSKIYLLE
ncbi:hypothetical protein V6N11_009342 [Hibiscus sabdariffa]|uniref:Uncharacterized protein n=2 Tax=Hibiscus sabdariffa TaxID=183260 RepID=A0ABR2NSJ0_9ROSI